MTRNEAAVRAEIQRKDDLIAEFRKRDEVHEKVILRQKEEIALLKWRITAALDDVALLKNEGDIDPDFLLAIEHVLTSDPDPLHLAVLRELLAGEGGEPR